MKKILFMTYGGGHVNIVLPLIQSLRKEQQIEPVVIGLTTSTIVLKRERIPYHSFLDFLPIEDCIQICKVGKEAIDAFHNPQSGISEKDAISYLGTSIYDLQLKFGKERANKLIQKEERKAFYPSIFMKKILDNIQPDLVVTTCSQRAEAAMTEVAQKNGIPVLRFIDLFGELKTKPKGDFFAVMSEFTKLNLIDRGIDEKAISIVGQPAFESLFYEVDFNVDTLKDNLQMQNKSAIFLFASQQIDSIAEIAEEVIKTFAKAPEFGLILKLHPSETGIIHSQLLKNYQNPSNIVLIKNEIETQNLLKISDVIITKHSTCGVEAILLDKPLITINLQDREEILPFAAVGAAYGVYEKGELKKAIHKVIESKDCQNGLKLNREQFRIIENSVESSLELIRSILTEQI